MASNLVRVLRSAPRSQQHVVSISKRELSALLTPTEEFPGIPATSPSTSSASKASVTTLSNGLTIVSENASSTSTVSLTFPYAGSSSESASEGGAALVNRYLAFKSGSGLSSAIILRNLENDGATPFASVSKSSSTVGYTAAKDKALRLVPLLATSCSFEKWDMNDAKALAGIEVEEATSNVSSVLSDSVFAAAYGAQSAYGKSLYSNSSPSSVAIQSFHQKAYGLNGAVLAATGIDDHEVFVKAVEAGLIESYVGKAASAAIASPFISGETRIHAPSTGSAHVALAFQGPKGSTPLSSIIQTCIDLSSNAITGFTNPSTGLTGVYATCAPSDAVSATDALCGSITTVPSADIITRAIVLAKKQALLSLDSGSSQNLALKMTESVLETNSFGFSNVAAAYDDVSVDQVQAAFSVMSKSAPAVAAVGDLSYVPYQGSLVSRFS
mmetsp:Transcript_14566/g.16569  ORF Transcript_14566/g.16569 Transcript_14566/m.16569 type:complete len:442 (-) Transcript_14566:224-1549(-)